MSGDFRDRFQDRLHTGAPRRRPQPPDPHAPRAPYSSLGRSGGSGVGGEHGLKAGEREPDRPARVCLHFPAGGERGPPNGNRAGITTG